MAEYYGYYMSINYVHESQYRLSIVQIEVE